MQKVQKAAIAKIRSPASKTGGTEHKTYLGGWHPPPPHVRARVKSQNNSDSTIVQLRVFHGYIAIFARGSESSSCSKWRTIWRNIHDVRRLCSGRSAFAAVQPVTYERARWLTRPATQWAAIAAVRGRSGSGRRRYEDVLRSQCRRWRLVSADG